MSRLSLENHIRKIVKEIKKYTEIVKIAFIEIDLQDHIKESSISVVILRKET